MVTCKPFLTYQDQISLLKKKGLTISNNAHAIQLLKNYSYFDLISGYKQPFKQKNGQYKLYTSIDDIVRLYAFDESLRTLFLQYILKVEKHIKSLLSYVFCSHHGNDEQHFLDSKKYFPQPNQQDIPNLTKKLDDIRTSTTYPYIKHQRTKHGNVPLWVIMKAMTFGTVSKMYTFLPQTLKIEISKEFQYVNESVLQTMLSLLSRIRNTCAHSERLFTYQDKHPIPDTDVHDILQIKKSNGQFKKGKKDLFAVLIVLKYLLPSNEFAALIKELDILITTLCRDVYNIQLSQIYRYLGFPQNWKDISSCPKRK